MPQQDLSRLGLRNGFNRGENGWGEAAFNYNFNKLSSLIHISIKEMHKRTPNSNDPVGTAYIVASNPYGVFQNYAGQIAFRDLSSPRPANGATSPATWYFQRPFTGMTIYNEADNLIYVYDNGWLPTRPPMVGCSYYLSSGYNPSGNNQLVPFNIAKWPSTSGISYNTASKYVDIQQTGYYDIRFQSLCPTTIVHSVLGGSIRTNNNNTIIASQQTGGNMPAQNSSYWSLFMQTIYPLSAGSNISFVLDNGPDNTAWRGGADITFFSVHRVG